MSKWFVKSSIPDPLHCPVTSPAIASSVSHKEITNNSNGIILTFRSFTNPPFTQCKKFSIIITITIYSISKLLSKNDSIGICAQLMWLQYNVQCTILCTVHSCTLPSSPTLLSMRPHRQCLTADSIYSELCDWKDFNFSPHVYPHYSLAALNAVQIHITCHN